MGNLRGRVSEEIHIANLICNIRESEEGGVDAGRYRIELVRELKNYFLNFGELPDLEYHLKTIGFNF